MADKIPLQTIISDEKLIKHLRQHKPVYQIIPKNLERNSKIVWYTENS